MVILFIFRFSQTYYQTMFIFAITLHCHFVVQSILFEEHTKITGILTGFEFSRIFGFYITLIMFGQLSQADQS